MDSLFSSNHYLASKLFENVRIDLRIHNFEKKTEKNSRFQ